MSTLYLLNDLGASMPWNFAAIHANKALLSRHNLELGPFNPWTCEILPTHSHLWRNIPDKIPPGIAKALDSLQDTLDAGKNALLLNVGIFLPGYQSLGRLLKNDKDLARHEIKPIFVIGRPMVVFEQRWRWAGKIAEKDRVAHVRRFASLDKLVEDARQTFGAENVVLLADLSDDPRSTRQDDLTARIFAELGCPAPDPSKSIPPHPLVFGSATARRLYNARLVRFNSWPALDEDAFRVCLHDFDVQWDNSPIAPLLLRKILQDEGRESQGRLKEYLDLEAGALDAPIWLLEEKEVTGTEPLDMDKVSAFAAALPQAVASPLRRRLENDSRLHFHAHKCLLEGLKSRPGAEYRHIGEPEQPIELTVLTMTYNHEKYIAECMDSVLAQKTDFPVRHLVLDHCSNDATPQIVAEYARKHPSIRPVLLNRRARAENCRGLFMRCRTKYAALCDGDDYFTDPQKLQLQVDFLRQNPKCGLVFHPVEIIVEGRAERSVYPGVGQLPRGVKKEYHLLDLVRSNFIQTNSVVYRWRFAEGLPDWFRANLCPGDWYWHLLHAETGRVGFMPRVMSVYRRHNNAVFVKNLTSPLEHRKNRGMAELESYKVCDEHFKGRYFSSFARLADNVLSDFVIVAQQEENFSLIDAALAKYPDFGRHFLDECRKREATENAE